MNEVAEREDFEHAQISGWLLVAKEKSVDHSHALVAAEFLN